MASVVSAGANVASSVVEAVKAIVKAMLGLGLDPADAKQRAAFMNGTAGRMLRQAARGAGRDANGAKTKKRPSRREWNARIAKASKIKSRGH